jgi:hypothetical protein
MILSLFILLFIILGSLVFTFTMTSVLSSDKEYSDTTMDALIQTNLSLMLTSTIDLFGEISAIVTGKSMVFLSGLPGQSLNIARFGVVIGGAIAFHEGYQYFLTGGDTMFRTLLGPLFQDVIFSVLQILRLFYDAIIPLYNYYSTIVGQLISGSISIAIKCDMMSVIETFKVILFTFVSLFESTIDFAGGRSVDNNIIVNDWNLTKTFDNAQKIISTQENIASCVCDGMTDIFSMLFVVTKTPQLPRALNHAFNIPIALIQEIIQILPPYSKIPLFTKLLYHTGSLGLEVATFADKVFVALFNKVIQLFIPEFYLKGAPEQFILATQARLWLAAIEILHVFYRTAIHIIVPVPKFILNPDFMMQCMDFSKGLLHLELWNYGNTNMLHWTAMLSKKLTTGLAKAVVTGGKLEITGVPEHVLLDCTKTSRYMYVKAPCFAYFSFQIPLNIAYGANQLINEVLWLSIFYQKQNLWRTFQRYDGMLISDDMPYSCEHRRDNMKWDVTRGKCMCEKPITNFPLNITQENPFGKNTLYDPYCGQPTMQAHYWYPFIMWFRQAMEGTLTDAWFVVLKTEFLADIALNRAAVRGVLAIPDIIEGNYLDIPLNCGWGTGDYSDCNVRRHPRNTINYCSGENGEGCTCNPSLPLEYNSTCQCIYYYPDAEQEVTQSAFENPLLENLYKPVTQHHWCGTYHFENIFALSEEFAYLIDNVISKFAPAYNSENNDYCQSKAYLMLATDVLQYGRDEWDDALLGNVSNVTYSYERDSCKLYGSYDVICSSSMTLRTGVFLITQQLRGMVMTAASFLSLDIQSFKFDLSERMCDLQRTAAGVSATIAAMFPVGFVGPGVQQGLARMMYSVLDVLIVALRWYNNFFLWFNDVIRGAAVGRSIEKPTFELIVNQLNLIIDWFRRVFQAFGTFMNGIHNGAGKFFFTVDKVLGIFQGLMSQAVLEMVTAIVKVLAGIVNLFASGGVVEGFFKDLWLLISKFGDMLMQQFAKLWALIEKALEPLMKIIRGIGGAFKSVCQTIEGAINSIPLVSVDMGCSRMRGTGHEHVFWSVPDTVLHVAENIDWDGVSRCDVMVHRYKNYTWNDLRPLEQIEIQECLEQRYIADQIANITDLPIPHDILYNWKRKYHMGYDIGHASILYMRHLFGGLTTSEMMHIMKHDHVNLDLYLPAMQRLKAFLTNTVTFSNANKLIHAAFNEYPDINTTNSAMGNFYRLYIHANTFANDALPHISDLPDQYTQMIHAVPKSHILRREFNLSSHIETIGSHMRRIPPLFNNLAKDRPMSKSKIQARNTIMNGLGPILGAAGLNADITPCSQREDAFVCVNCLILDNLLDVVIKEGRRMGGYYENTFSKIIVPEFVDYFEKQDKRAKAYREDLSESYQKAMDAANTDGARLRREQKMFSNATDSLSPRKLALKDWEYLLKNWELRNNEEIVDILLKFIGTVDETYVPLTGYGLGYYLTYPFVESCPMEIIYCDLSTTQERMGYISNQFGYQALTFLSLYLAQIYTGTPVFQMATGAMAMPIIMFAIYGYATYGYLYTCLPNIPNCLMDDLFVWFHDVAYPRCFCQYYPGLSDSCDPELCFLSSKVTTFANCTAEVPLSSYDNMGYLWSPVFWFRTEFPDAFLLLYKTPPFSWVLGNFEGVKDIAIRLQESVPITLSEIDCLGLRYSDFVMMGVVIYVVAFALSIIIPVSIKVTIHIIKVAIIFLNTLYAFGVSTELQTIAGMDS